MTLQEWNFSIKRFYLWSKTLMLCLTCWFNIIELRVWTQFLNHSYNFAQFFVLKIAWWIWFCYVKVTGLVWSILCLCRKTFLRLLQKLNFWKRWTNNIKLWNPRFRFLRELWFLNLMLTNSFVEFGISLTTSKVKFLW